MTEQDKLQDEIQFLTERVERNKELAGIKDEISKEIQKRIVLCFREDTLSLFRYLKSEGVTADFALKSALEICRIEHYK